MLIIYVVVILCCYWFLLNLVCINLYVIILSPSIKNSNSNNNKVLCVASELHHAAQGRNMTCAVSCFLGQSPSSAPPRPGETLLSGDSVDLMSRTPANVFEFPSSPLEHLPEEDHESDR